MRKVLLLSLSAFWIGLFASLNAVAETSDHDQWFQNEYARLWVEKPWNNRDEIAAYYTKSFTEHPADDFQQVYSNQEVLGNDLASWQKDGWLSSAVVGYQSELLNKTTATFKIKWRDVYTNTSDELSCAWYMADFTGEKWLFTQYADIDCAPHGM
jgi:hypothetical protein